LLRRLLGKLGHLGSDFMEQSYGHHFTLFKCDIDFFIGRHLQVHGRYHRLGGSHFATI